MTTTLTIFFFLLVKIKTIEKNKNKVRTH